MRKREGEGQFDVPILGCARSKEIKSFTGVESDEEVLRFTHQIDYYGVGFGIVEDRQDAQADGEVSWS
jgi:hypothetical protein